MDNNKKDKQKNEHINFAMMFSTIKIFVILLIIYGINGSLSYTVNEITQFLVKSADIPFYTWSIIVLKIFFLMSMPLIMCCLELAILLSLFSLFFKGLYTKLFNYVNLKFTSREEDFLLNGFYKYKHLHQYSEEFKELVYSGFISEESLARLVNDNELYKILTSSKCDKLWYKLKQNQQFPQISRSNKGLLVRLSRLSELNNFKDLIIAIYNGRDKIDKLALKQLLQPGGFFEKRSRAPAEIIKQHLTITDVICLLVAPFLVITTILLATLYINFSLVLHLLVVSSGFICILLFIIVFATYIFDKYGILSSRFYSFIIRVAIAIFIFMVTLFLAMQEIKSNTMYQELRDLHILYSYNSKKVNKFRLVIDDKVLQSISLILGKNIGLCNDKAVAFCYTPSGDKLSVYILKNYTNVLVPPQDRGLIYLQIEPNGKYLQLNEFGKAFLVY
ncbi:MAG: hypothetical protein K0R14_252 [Burkholderiales bacterium]|nr:hypothetical protein [Burkholderiales bacterium]